MNLFFVVVILQCAGVTFVVVGSWAFSENYKFTSSSSSDTPKYSNVFDVVFDLTILIIVLGLIIFIIAFAGCIGALRENICLLKFVSDSLHTRNICMCSVRMVRGSIRTTHIYNEV